MHALSLVSIHPFHLLLPPSLPLPGVIVQCGYSLPPAPLSPTTSSPPTPSLWLHSASHGKSLSARYIESLVISSTTYMHMCAYICTRQTQAFNLISW